MDRFIEERSPELYASASYLKSNMDRFIVLSIMGVVVINIYLKSNMDRFIVWEQLPLQCSKRI